jgi:hypothetical protein
MHLHECNTHNFLFNQKIKQWFFLYYIPCKEKNIVGKNLNLRENYYLIIHYIHILKLEISRCDIQLVRAIFEKFGAGSVTWGGLAAP